MTWRSIIALIFLAGTAAAAEQPTVLMDVVGESAVRGVLTDPVIRFDLDSGPAAFQAARLRALKFGSKSDTILVDGQEHEIKGRCLNTELTVELAGGPRTFARAEIKSLKAVHSGAANWFGDIIVPLVTLTAMEIVLGIDNIIFLAIVASRLPKAQQPRARRIGLFAALGTRLLLLATLTFILGLTTPVFTLPAMPFFQDAEAREVSWRDIILLVGGLFLIGKSTLEIHDKLGQPHEGESDSPRRSASASFGWVLVQIAVIDIIFSLDSVITAVGMVDSIWIMVTAMMVAVGVMLIFAESISQFVARNPTLKILALAFLILIGVMLVAEGFGQHIEKGYVYFAMAFSVGVEVINLQLRKKTDPLKLTHSELPVGLS